MTLERLGDFLKDSYGKRSLTTIQASLEIAQRIKEKIGQDVNVIIGKNHRIRILCPDSSCAYALKLRKKKILLMCETVLKYPLSLRDIQILVTEGR